MTPAKRRNLNFTLALSCLVWGTFSPAMTHAVDDGVLIKQAKKIQVSDVVIEHHKEFGFSPEEFQRLKAVSNGLQRVLRQKILDSWDAKPGEPIVGNPLDLHKRQTAEERAEIQAIIDTRGENIESLLTPAQRRIAEYLVLRERMRIAGAQVILVSSDLSVVDLRKLARSPREIMRTLQKGELETNRMVKNQPNLSRMERAKLRDRELQSIMRQLGSDGELIKSIVEEIPKEPQRPGYQESRTVTGPLGR